MQLWGTLHKIYYLIYTVLRNNSDVNMSHYGIGSVGRLMEIKGEPDRRYLAILTSSRI